MRVDGVALTDFRNYGHAEVELASGLNLIVGRNAQGKTNLLEAVYCLTGLGSPRSPDAALVRAGCERAVIHGRVTRGSREMSIDIELRVGRGPRALLNRTPVTSLRALGEVVVAVFFGPDELSLIKGSPDGRRRFLDDLVVKLRPGRFGFRRELERVLKQRNALLKSAPRGSHGRAAATLDVWDQALRDVGAALTAARLEALGAILPRARSRYRDISGGGELQLNFASSWLDQDLADTALEAPETIDTEKIKEVLATEIARARPRELDRGISLVGPQRDDVSVAIAGDEGDGLDARTYASQGDQRSVALALKLGEHDLLTAELAESPILLLDDVFSELDQARRDWLIGAVRDMDQSILTSAEPGAVGGLDADATIEVEAGKVKRGG